MNDSIETEMRLASIMDMLTKLSERVDNIYAIMHGSERGEFGYMQKVSIMWRIHVVWPLCTASAVFGAMMTLMIQHFSH